VSEILGLAEEWALLYDQLVDAVDRGFGALRDPPDEEAAQHMADLAVAGVLRRLRVMSARQLAVVLAAEANRGEVRLVCEPSDYT
jgi:hypothetical protein